MYSWIQNSLRLVLEDTDESDENNIYIRPSKKEREKPRPYERNDYDDDPDYYDPDNEGYDNDDYDDEDQPKENNLREAISNFMVRLRGLF